MFPSLLKFALWYEDRSRYRVLEEGYGVLSSLRAPENKDVGPSFLRRARKIKFKLVPFLNNTEVKILHGALENEISKIENSQQDLTKKMLEFSQTMESIIKELKQEINSG